MPGVGEMYKSTLVAQLNQNPSVSADRLKRVRTTNTKARQSDVLEEECSVNTVELHDDCALLIKDKGKLCTFQVCRIQRMRKKGARSSYIKYKRPIPLQDIPNQATVELIVNMYSKFEDNYVYSDNSSKVFPLTCVLMPVTMSILETGKYTLSAQDKENINTLIGHENTCQKRKGPVRPCIKDLPDDGRRIRSVTSVSGRKRRQITFECH